MKTHVLKPGKHPPTWYLQSTLLYPQTLCGRVLLDLERSADDPHNLKGAKNPKYLEEAIARGMITTVAPLVPLEGQVVYFEAGWDYRRIITVEHTPTCLRCLRK